MNSNNGNNKERSIANFAALKTAIAGGDEKLVKELAPQGPIIEMERSYLIELAELNNNSEILKILKGIPVKE